MLRTNLSTRPFYNERAAHLVIGIAAVLVLALTVWNVVRVIALSRHNTELSARVGRERAEAQRLTDLAASTRKSLDTDDLAAVVRASHEANTLIDQRTFSWTEFFNRIESTIPPDVMLQSVRPTFRDEQARVSMVALGRRVEDIDEFIEKLEATGAFEDVLPAQQDRTEQGLYRVVIESRYTPEAAKGDPAPAAPAEAAPARAAEPAPASRGVRR